MHLFTNSVLSLNVGTVTFGTARLKWDWLAISAVGESP